MWVRMLAYPGGAAITAIESIPVAVDVQVRKVTEYLGVARTRGQALEKIGWPIQEIWGEGVRRHGTEDLRPLPTRRRRWTRRYGSSGSGDARGASRRGGGFPFQKSAASASSILVPLPRSHRTVGNTRSPVWAPRNVLPCLGVWQAFRPFALLMILLACSLRAMWCPLQHTVHESWT